jgi:DNA primase
MKFPPALLDEIRARLPVSQVVARKVALKKAGREWRGLSPFKSEKTPSFYVNDQKGFYHCFASGEHGDIFKFVMTTEGLTFPEAVERLAAEAGVPLPKFEPRSPAAAERYEKEQDERTRLYALLDASQAFFVAQLRGAGGQFARTYVEHKRGLSRDTIEAFGLGFAPNTRTALKSHLAGLGFRPDEMIASGMLIGGDDIPEPYDRFRNRVMFPITDLKGRVIAFGGRALEADVPAKYLNSPETLLFHKGSVLFNAARARPLAHQKARILVVEGYMDVVALTEGGFGEAVAPLGTALTDDQVRLLWRMTDEPILCFDGDSAGRKAAFRAIDVAMPYLKPGVSLRFAFLPDGLDPDDLIRQNGPAAMEACLARTRSLVDVLWDREWASGDWSTPERRAQLELQLNTLMARIENESVRIQYQKDIRNRLYEAWGAQRRQDGRSSTHRLGGPRPPFGGHRPNGPRGKPPFGPPVRQPASDSLRQSRLGAGQAIGAPQREAVLMLTLLNHPWLIEQRCEELASLDLTHRPYAALKAAMLEIVTASMNSDAPALDAAQLHTQLRSVGLDGIADQIVRVVTHTGDKFALSSAEPAAVVGGFDHALGLHRRQLELIRALEQAERAWLLDQSEENLARISELKALQGQRIDLDHI